ncbi:MAG: hypothetical protein J0L92_04380 [Deltaproteobacteria bacterium]|nr:hypothetical protein [Deltaproteobacteria bacterium]
MLRPAVSTTICFEDEGAALGVHGPLVIAVISGRHPFSAHAARRAVDEVSRLRKTTHRGALLYAYVMGELAEVPGAEARNILAELPNHMDASVGVHEGSGFRASMIRAVVTGIAMASRARIHPDIVATVPVAAARICARYPTLDEKSVVAAFERVRTAALEGA